MDEYLNPDAAYKRLLKEYKERGTLDIAVDVDHTLYDYDNKGHSYEMVRQLVRDLYSVGMTIIIWTANPRTEFVKEFLSENNIPFHYYNENSLYGLSLYDEHGFKETRKIYSQVYIDDRASLYETYDMLIKLLKKLYEENRP